MQFSPAWSGPMYPKNKPMFASDSAMIQPRPTRIASW
jgi:hypothetical protein